MKKITAALLLTIVITPAFASDDYPYIGANFGQTNTRFAPNSPPGTAITLLLGRQLSEDFAIEAQIGDLGSFTLASGKTAKTTGYSLTVLGFLPLSEQWAGYAKVGYARTYTKFGAGAVSAAGYTAARDTTTAGIGGQFKVNSAIKIRLGYDVYGIGDPSSGTAKTNVVSVGAVFKF